MKQTIIYWLSIGLTLLSVSCEKAIDYNGKDLQPVLVLNSRISTGDSIVCHLSSSKPITSVNGLVDIDGAKIELSKNGVVSGLFESRGTGKYSISHIVEKNAEYSLSVSKSGYSSISTNCVVPDMPSVSITKIEAQQTYIRERQIYGIPKLKFRITIADPTKENFYRIRVFQKYATDIIYYTEKASGVNAYEGEPESFSWGETYFETNDPLLSRETDEFSNEPENEYNIFADYSFNGEQYEIPIEVDFGWVQENPWLADSIPLQYKIEVQSLTKGLFLYYKSLVAQDWYGDSPFSEPVQLFANVKNGFGIFGATTSQFLYMTPDLIHVTVPKKE